jgi:hypothetical protein
MISTPRGRHGRRQRTAAAGLLPASDAERSVVEPQTVRAWARRFTDPHDVTWWVHLVRQNIEPDIARRRRLPPMTLRFQNGIGAHARYLLPIPPDWRECDDVALWGYCEHATW